MQEGDRVGGASGDRVEAELGLVGREREDIETAASEEVGTGSDEEQIRRHDGTSAGHIGRVRVRAQETAD